MIQLLISILPITIYCTWIGKFLGEKHILMLERQLCMALGIRQPLYEISKIILFIVFIGFLLLLEVFSTRNKRNKYELPNSLYKNRI